MTLAQRFAADALRTWVRGDTARDRYRNAVRTIDELTADPLAQREPVPYLRTLTADERDVIAFEVAAR